jgi:glycosyltransferase involved in cell wall biosynthesis
VDDAGVTRAYHEAAVAVCPSRFEGFGVTPMEAVGCGTPVVASDIPPHREFVGHVAQLVPLDSPERMAAAIAERLEGPRPDPEQLRELTIPAAAERFKAGLRPLLG